MSMKVKRSHHAGSLLFKGFKVTWKMGLLILNAILDIASDKPSKPRPIFSAQISPCVRIVVASD